ncbi:MAG: agmatinase [Conexivisphaerales archaeon]
MTYSELFLNPEPNVSYRVEGKKPISKVFGVPYDATSSFKPGSRFGPNALREAFMKIEVYDPGLDVDADKLPVEDLGNLQMTSTPQEMVDAVSKVTEEIVSDGYVPGVIGGEHTLTFGTFSAMPPNTHILVFDAHFDLRANLYGWELGHGTFLRRLSERIGYDKVIHVGGRSASREEWRLVKSEKLKTIFSKDIGKSKYLDEFRYLMTIPTKVYVSVDLDILDPAYMPGTGTPEPGGITSKELFSMLEILKGKEIVGFDVVELNPMVDPYGISSATAAKVFSLLLSLVSLMK